MSAQQPDNRIKREELGTFSINGKRYVIHNSRGCPRNAVIEIFDGYLRCWACKKPLTDMAAKYVRSKAHPRDLPEEENYDVFIWERGFYHNGSNKRRVQERPPLRIANHTPPAN